MSKFYNQNTCSEDEVWIVLQRSKKFGWSWCKDKAEPFRHTAIVLYFDDKALFTINFRTENGASKAACAFSEAKELITIENVADTDYEYFTALDDFAISTPFGKRRAKDKIKAILSFSPGNYNLFFNNCRDHVKGVVEHFAGKGSDDVPDGGFERGMNQIRNEDTVRKMAAAGFAVLATGAVVWAVSKALGSKGEEDSEEVKA